MKFKPHDEEQKWAKRMEMDIKKELLANLPEEEKEKLRELHWKKCPKDGVDLVDININGIVVEKCLICEGIWLNRGEIEKIFQFTKSPNQLIKHFAKVLDIEISH